MTKGKFYLLEAVFSLLALILIMKVASLDSEAVPEVLFVCLAGWLVIFLLYYGIHFLRWIAAPGVAILAVGTFLAGTESGEAVFFVLSVGYAFIAWQVFEVRAEKQTAEEIPDDDDTRQSAFPADGYRYPSLLRRIQATLIDGVVQMAFMIGIMLLSDPLEYKVAIRVSAVVATVLLYEPLLTVFSATAGQRLAGIRVRSEYDLSKRIGVVNAYARTFTKWLLGWLSFVTIHFNKQRRAIHDFTGSSVVIFAEEPVLTDASPAELAEVDG